MSSRGYEIGWPRDENGSTKVVRKCAAVVDNFSCFNF